MRVAVAAAAALAGCSGESLLVSLPAPIHAAHPLTITGWGQYELWTALDVGNVAAVATTTDRGAYWQRYNLPQLDGAGALQIAAQHKRLWIVGTDHQGSPALLELSLEGADPVIQEFPDLFPPGTTDVRLHSGGVDPSVMITAQVPGQTGRALFLMRETVRAVTWLRHPIGNIRSLVGIYGPGAAYFITTNGAAPDKIVYCALTDTSAHCLDVPLDRRTINSVYTTTPTPQNDWLWHAEADGGLIVHRIGPNFETHQVDGWPDLTINPVRFFALESGELGMVANRDQQPVWVTLDSLARVVRETPLGRCNCELNPERVMTLPDSIVVLPTPDGWALVDPP